MIPKEKNYQRHISSSPIRIYYFILIILLIIRVLLAKGMITPDELRQSIEVVDSWGQKAQGPRIVAKAWVDPVFKENLLREASTVLNDLEIPTSNYGYVLKLI
jgi:hypothetical protein